MTDRLAPTDTHDGPRALAPDEWPLLDRLVSDVFRPEMFHDYPQLFTATNRSNLRVIRDGDHLATHVGIVIRPATLLGCAVTVASMGAVATARAARGRGFGSACVQDAFDHAAAQGVHLMHISGGRDLYVRVGCRPVGNDRRYDLIAGAHAAALHRPNLRVAPAGPDDIDALAAIHATEPVRFVRPREDWVHAMDCTIVMNTPSDFWAVHDDHGPIAYLVVHQPDRLRNRPVGAPRLLRPVEVGGDREAVAAALPALLDHYGAAKAEVHVVASDTRLSSRLDAVGAEWHAEATSGTVRVIDFVGLMERVRPLVAARIGEAAASRLTFQADERPGSARGGFTIHDGASSVRIASHGDLGPWLFGAPDNLVPSVHGDHDLAVMLCRALPLPTLWYGLNYV
jgi:predicted N-acetyltransferase YhbS